MPPPITIGDYSFTHLLALAPMAGVTDRPFRQLCRRLGANWTPSEMLHSQVSLRNTRKSKLRSDHTGEPPPIIVQIAGADPVQMAEAARYNVEQGADVIDINMGCPAKKVCNVAAGSALLADEARVEAILKSVVKAVNVPVTLKTRTGTDPSHRNAPTIGKIAQECGISMLALHGRTRADKFMGEAEYDTIAEVKQQLTIPVLANGDITTAEQAVKVLKHTQADGLMIGRGAQGNPWIFREIKYRLNGEEDDGKPTTDEIVTTLLTHLDGLHTFYGDVMGVRIARKHIAWYLQASPLFGAQFGTYKQRLFAIEDAGEQRQMVEYLLRSEP